MQESDPITVLKGVGPAVAKKFELVGIRTLGDLIDYYPRRYDDYSDVTPIAALDPGPVTIAGTIQSAKGRYVRRGMHITEAIAEDETGSVRMIWFNQPYREAALKAGQRYFISGNYELKQQRFTIQNPSIELISDLPTNTARILPIYRETKGLNSRQIRVAMRTAEPLLRTAAETLPEHIIEDEDLLPRADALCALQFPESSAELEEARRRLGFEEVFQLTLASLMNKQENRTETALQITYDEGLVKKFVASLPFTLTDAQRKTAWQLYQDMQKTEPMNRLVEGDVGAGKTVVAAMAAIVALNDGWQVALMAPTEILARQHAETLYKILEPIGYANQVGLLVGALTKAQKDHARASIASGNIRFMIGTQALIQESVNMEKLALVIIDEQHRFGVDQRKTLMAKAGHMPHVLSLTATPIPRSLALTLYGELDVSILDQKPGGRKPIITEIHSPNSRKQLYETVEAELIAGRQMFVVCPLITDSTVLEATSAEQVYESFTKKDFKHRTVGLLHGKLKPLEKQAIMEQFVRHELDILVSTTVIEVGVDVPNASIMLIESAERFGLAQLHQLRGRVGRGSDQGYCYLMLSDSKQPSRRLRALESSNDGFKLAELDLGLRGPGAIYGTSQSGALDLRIAKLSDVKLIASARKQAQALLDSGEDLLQYPHLMKHVTRLRAVTNLN